VNGSKQTKNITGFHSISLEEYPIRKKSLRCVRKECYYLGDEQISKKYRLLYLHDVYVYAYMMQRVR